MHKLHGKIHRSMSEEKLKRKPLLDEYQDPPYFVRYNEGEAGAFYDGVDFARDFYEAKIASGELIHVGIANLRRVMGDDGFTPCIQCSCGTSWKEVDHISCNSNRCASCSRTFVGSKIIE